MLDKKKLIKQIAPVFILALCAGFLLSAVDGYITILTMDIVDFALASNMDEVKSTILKLAFAAALVFPIATFKGYAKSKYKEVFNRKLKSNYIDKLFDKNISEFQAENTGRYVSTMTNDFNIVDQKLIDTFYEVVNNIIAFIVAVFVISKASILFVFIAIGILLLNIAISILTNKPLARHTKERSDLFDGFTAYIKELLSAFHIIKNNDLDSRIRENYYDKSKHIQQKGYVIDKMSSLVSAVENFNAGLVFIGSLTAIGVLAFKGMITVGGSVLAAQGIQRLAQPLTQLAELLPKLFTTKDLLIKIDDSLKNTRNFIEDISLDEFNNGITLKDVSYAYGENRVLENVNFKFEKGKKYLVVGPSGGGKSTILKLLRKYDSPKNGEILVDGHPLNRISKESYFSKVSNVEQMVFVFEDTLRNNISLYKEYSDDEILSAMDKAGLTEFVGKLPDGLETMIYDNGKNISGGERSRLVIARALLNNSKIILLDEAFASLNEETAKRIEKTILSLEDITIINVSHCIFKENRELYDNMITVSNKNIKVS